MIVGFWEGEKCLGGKEGVSLHFGRVGCSFVDCLFMTNAMSKTVDP